MRIAHNRPWICVLLYFGLCAGGGRCVFARQSAQPNLFEFHSGFWVNLHHFLYREARLAALGEGSPNLSLTEADEDELAKLSPAERAEWNHALRFYSQIVKRDLLFDSGLTEIKNRLEDAETSADLENVDIPADLKAVLLKAAPVYRRHWWPRHNAQNLEWIAALNPLVAHYGPALSRELSLIYGEPWPGYPVRVDTVAYSNWASAYTTIEPTRPTISSIDPGNQGTAALEIVFHETSHGVMHKVIEAINAAEARVNARGKAPNFHAGSLWHGVLFFTAGELVADQVHGYTMYADKKGLWGSAWPRVLIEQDWGPHMKGLLSLQNALTKLVDDVASASHNH